MKLALDGLAVQQLAKDHLLLDLILLACGLNLLLDVVRKQGQCGVDHALGDGITIDGRDDITGGLKLARNRRLGGGIVAANGAEKDKKELVM